MAGRNAQQSRILHSAGGTVGSFDEIEAVTNISGPTGTANNIDVTDLRSTAKEFLAGLADYGNVTLSLNYVGGTKQLDLYDMFRTNADPQPFKIAFPTSAAATAFDVLAFDASVQSCQWGAQVDGKQDLSITLKTSGAADLTQNVATGSLA